MADKRDRADKPRRSRRQIALTVIFKQFGARFAEKGIRLLPQDALEWILNKVPQGVVTKLLDDDNQDAVANVASALLESFGLSEDASIVVETIIKEAIEEVGLRVEELGGGDAEFETYFDHALGRRMNRLEDPEMSIKKKADKPRLSFTQRLADKEIDAAQRTRFDGRLAAQPDAERAHYFVLMGEAVAELDEVKRLIAIDDDAQFFDHFNDFLRRAPKLSEKSKSIWERMTERAGDFADPDGPKMQAAKTRMEADAASHNATADRLARLRRGR